MEDEEHNLMSDNYETFVAGKTAEEILAADRAWGGNPVVARYLQIAAQVRSNGDLWWIRHGYGFR
jgi:hypothetical protein